MLDTEKLEKAKQEIKKDIEDNEVILYMKGDKNMPRCGFSAKVVEILNSTGVDYATRNVLEDGYVRQGIKEHSNWPTVPQLYVKQEFIGGCDIVMEMESSNTFQNLFQ